MPLFWSDEEVAERWLKAYPGKLDKPKFAQQRELKKQAIMEGMKTLRMSALGKFAQGITTLDEVVANSSPDKFS